MTVFDERRHTAEFVLSEANGMRSRGSITIESGSGVVAAGTVVGEDGAGKFVPSPETAADGTDTARAITLYEVDATSADVDVAAILRDAEVNGNILTYDSTVDTAGKKAAKADDLAGHGIIVR